MSSDEIEKDRIIDLLCEKFEHQKTIYQPNPESFFNEPGFNIEEIKKEIELTSGLKKKWDNQNNDFEKKNKKLSDVFEGIIVDQLCGDWMAGKAQAFFTAEADDYIRKVDCVIEFNSDNEEETKEYLGLGIDVTFSSDYQTIQSKLDAVWNSDVKKGKEVEIKYVETEDFKGSLSVCRVILVADKSTVYEPARLYRQKDKTEINEHPFLANILSQIKIQLESYYIYAKEKNLGSDYLRHVTKTLSVFYGVYSEKENFIKDHYNDVANSDVFKEVEQYCKDKLKNL